MKKKLISGLMTAVMATVMLTGCGGSGSSTSADATAQDSGTQKADSTPAAGTDTAKSDDAAGNNSIVTEQTNLTFIFADGDEGAKAAMNTIVDKFNAAYDNITVTIEPGNGGLTVNLLRPRTASGSFLMCWK